MLWTKHSLAHLGRAMVSSSRHLLIILTRALRQYLGNLGPCVQRDVQRWETKTHSWPRLQHVVVYPPVPSRFLMTTHTMCGWLHELVCARFTPLLASLEMFLERSPKACLQCQGRKPVENTVSGQVALLVPPRQGCQIKGFRLCVWAHRYHPTGQLGKVQCLPENVCPIIILLPLPFDIKLPSL